MKNINAFLIVLCFLVCDDVKAQVAFTNASSGRTLEFCDLNGNSLYKEEYEPDIEGSPFLNQDWIFSTLLTIRGKQLKNVPVKLNIESNELYYLNSTGKTLFAAEGIVKKISFNNFIEKENVLLVFQNGYPSINKQSPDYIAS